MDGLSVILPTLNRTDFLKDTLDCLVVQKFDHPYEIIIVDQSSQPDQKIIPYTLQYTYIHYFHITSFRGLPEARNYGWQKAKFDYILYLDDDILCESDLLAEHYKYIVTPNIGVVAGGTTERYKKNVDCKIGYFNFFLAKASRGFHKKYTVFVDHAIGANFSVKKSLLLQLNGIDENLTKGAALYEETDFCLRVKRTNYKIFFNYHAHVFHLAAPTGGCRVDDIQKYIFNLCRNKSVIIVRHLRWYHKGTAYLYLLRLICSYTLSYKNRRIFKSGLQGIFSGRQVGKLPAKCTVVNNE